MKKHLRTLLVGVSALIALGTLSACSGGKTTEATPTSEAVTTPSATATPFPQSARYVADMKAADGKTMTIGISVDGASIAAYACNGTDDEAWFFGNQTDGKIDIKSRFKDTLKAEFNGTDVGGRSHDERCRLQVHCRTGIRRSRHVHRRFRGCARILGGA